MGGSSKGWEKKATCPCGGRQGAGEGSYRPVIVKQERSEAAGVTGQTMCARRCVVSMAALTRPDLPFSSSLPPALSCNENDGDHLDRDQQYPSNQKTKRMRTSFKHHQLRTMKSYFAINHNPDAKDLKQLAQKTGLTKRVLQVREAEALPLASSKLAVFFPECQKDDPVAPTARLVCSLGRPRNDRALCCVIRR